MRTVALSLLFLAACSATDVTPDEFHVNYGRGWASNEFDQRATDFDTDLNMVGFGFTWNIGASQAEADRQRQHELLLRAMNLMAAKPEEPAASTVGHYVAPPEDKKPETPKPTNVVLTDVIGDAKEYVLYGLGLVLVALAAFLKRQTIVSGVVKVRRSLGRRKADREK